MKSDKSGGFQYGVLPWRMAARLEILLITSRDTGRWVIPKGWPVVGLSGGESGVLEAFEEAGVEGDLDPNPIGVYPYEKRLKAGESRPLMVEVHPLRVTSELPVWPEMTERQRQWFSPAEAADAVAEPELAELIRAFAPSLP